MSYAIESMLLRWSMVLPDAAASVNATPRGRMMVVQTDEGVARREVRIRPEQDEMTDGSQLLSRLGHLEV